MDAECRQEEEMPRAITTAKRAARSKRRSRRQEEEEEEAVESQEGMEKESMVPAERDHKLPHSNSEGDRASLLLVNASCQLNILQIPSWFILSKT